MTRTERDQVARTLGESARARGALRWSLATDTRGLAAAPADDHQRPADQQLGATVLSMTGRDRSPTHI